MSAARILVVDDEPSIVELVSAYLAREGYMVRIAADGSSALQEAQRFDPDVVILDIMLPGIDGLEVLSRLRATSDAYVILLTARTEEVDRVIGLSVGADDYVTKPFGPRELVARVKAALRRLQPSDSAQERTLAFRHVRIDPGSRRVWRDGEEASLTATEFDLLRVLAENAGRVLSRAQLLEAVWGYDFYGEERVVDVHLGHVRQKLGEPSLIATVRGVGYRFEDEPLWAP
jgi:two-component system, OmpR family, alkaline phosphatase synthesis response regulator PhoP